MAATNRQSELMRMGWLVILRRSSRELRETSSIRNRMVVCISVLCPREKQKSQTRTNISGSLYHLWRRGEGALGAAFRNDWE